MLILLYILNSALALLFLLAGANKAIRAKDSLQKMGMLWVEGMSATLVKTIGLLEILGAIGLILPLLFNIAPILSPIAALCLATIMAAAAILHVRRGEAFVMQIALTVLTIASAVIGFAITMG